MADEHDTTMPDGPWAFDEEVTAVFGDMLSRSIPGYREMRSLVHRVGMYYATPDYAMLDLGCSRGDTIASFLAKGAFGRYVGIDASAPMTDFASLRFEAHANVDIRHGDLLAGYWGMQHAGLVTSVLTAQFVPVEERLRLFQMVRSVLPTGAFILVEKVSGMNGSSNDLLDHLYDDHKRREGYTDEAIIRKKAALEGVLVPVSAQLNEAWLYSAGFTSVEMFWRNLNFAGWVATP